MDAPILIDLDHFDTEKRKAAWHQAVPSLFPGVTVDEFRGEPTVGAVRGKTFGSARLWEIDSGPVNIRYSPRQASPKNLQAFSVMLQLSGETDASQNGRACELTQGDFCLIDGSSPFRLSVEAGRSKILVVQLPRQNVLNRHPHFQRMTATRISSNEEGGVRLLRNTLMSIREVAPYLCDAQQWNTLSLLVDSLSLLAPPGEGAGSVEWRVRRALGFMNTRLGDSLLTADDVAAEQGISRRQLDRIFKKMLGATVTTQLWERRLQHAASLLRDRDPESRLTVTQAALASGFQDPSHFSRAFRRRFGVQPSKWRAIAAESDVGADVSAPRDVQLSQSGYPT